MRNSLIFSTLLFIACSPSEEKKDQETKAVNSEYTKIGKWHIEDPQLLQVVDTSKRGEILAVGFNWSEGPLWLEQEDALIFSDVPENKVYKWTEKDSISIYLDPSGYTGAVEYSGESGSNGLLLDPKGNLVLCQHGNRQMAMMNAPLSDPKSDFTPLAQTYNGKRFNSPNDAAYDSKGNLYFTDPPYGLPDGEDSEGKELDFQGVFKLTSEGELILVTDSIKRPNGIGVLPGDSTIIVANSDRENRNWYLIKLLEDGSYSKPVEFNNVQDSPEEWMGNPDGLKIDRDGNIFATGPGGLWIFGPEGNYLGNFLIDGRTSNCALDGDESTIYTTSDDRLVRIKLR